MDEYGEITMSYAHGSDGRWYVFLEDEPLFSVETEAQAKAFTHAIGRAITEIDTCSRCGSADVAIIKKTKTKERLQCQACNRKWWAEITTIVSTGKDSIVQ